MSRGTSGRLILDNYLLEYRLSITNLSYIFAFFEYSYFRINLATDTQANVFKEAFRILKKHKTRVFFVKTHTLLTQVIIFIHLISQISS